MGAPLGLLQPQPQHEPSRLCRVPPRTKPRALLGAIQRAHSAPSQGKSLCAPRAIPGMLESCLSHGISQALQEIFQLLQEQGRRELPPWRVGSCSSSRHSPLPNSYLIFFLKLVFFLKQQLLESCDHC